MSRAPIVLSVLAMCVGWGGFVARRTSVASPRIAAQLRPIAPATSATPRAPLPSEAPAPPATSEAPRAVSASPSTARASACDELEGALVIAFGPGQTTLDRRALDRVELFARALIPRPDTARRRQALLARVRSVSAAGEREDRSARSIADDRLASTRAALLRAGLWHMQLASLEGEVRADVARGCVRVERAPSAADDGGV